MSHDRLEVRPFDHHFLVDKPGKLQELAALYCRVWETDENFGEYRICPTCSRYYNYEQVEVQGIISCSRGHEATLLVRAWETEKVAQTVLTDSQGEFYGAILVEPLGGQIHGFAWGCVIGFDHIRNTWGERIVAQLEQHTGHPKVAYFDELGVEASQRGSGYGLQLAKSVCGWMTTLYPELMSILRTHEKSNAIKIYQRLGYSTFAVDTQYGDGRVMMWVNPCSSIRLD